MKLLLIITYVFVFILKFNLVSAAACSANSGSDFDCCQADGLTTGAKKTLTNVVFQGGMSPKILLKNDKEIYDEAKKYMDIFSDVPYIFNLGHGLLPETNPETLGKLVNFIKENNV